MSVLTTAPAVLEVDTGALVVPLDWVLASDPAAAAVALPDVEQETLVTSVGWIVVYCSSLLCVTVPPPSVTAVWAVSVLTLTPASLEEEQETLVVSVGWTVVYWSPLPCVTVPPPPAAEVGATLF